MFLSLIYKPVKRNNKLLCRVNNITFIETYSCNYFYNLLFASEFLQALVTWQHSKGMQVGGAPKMTWINHQIRNKVPTIWSSHKGARHIGHKNSEKTINQRLEAGNVLDSFLTYAKWIHKERQTALSQSQF